MNGDRGELFEANGQRWLVRWHAPGQEPGGTAHGSAGFCLTSDGGVVLASEDGVVWDLPGGRPEAGEDWRATFEREVREEACARLDKATLLGFSRSECVEGDLRRTVLVRSLWLAQVTLLPWEPRHEMTQRRVVSASELAGMELGGVPPGILGRLVAAAEAAG
jgi:ADP-ribose pyrophosphatase YjhB (NUDIX family)